VLSTNIHNSEIARAYCEPVGRKVDPDDLVGAHEIAQRLGVARPQVVHEWRRRHDDFPEPIATLKTALIWDWRDVQQWARVTGRLG
jgi:predicted DNA-binding transcriptional regulator AlpA